MTENGLPVPRIIPTFSNETWVTIYGLKFVLFEYIRGLRYEGSVKQIKSAAANLAKIHSLQFPYKDILNESIFELALEHINTLEQCLVPKPETKEIEFQLSFNKFKAQVLERFKLVVQEAYVQCSNFGFDNFDKIGIHGDYNPWNLLFNNSAQVAGILDFDNSTLGSKIYDLAKGILMFCIFTYRGDSTNFRNIIFESIALPKTNEFLQAYLSLNQLSTNEWRCLPWVIKVVLVELFCLGFIRGDFSLEQYPSMLNCLDRQIDLP